MALLAVVVVVAAAPLHGLDEYDVDGKVYLSHARDSLAAVLPIVDVAVAVAVGAVVEALIVDLVVVAGNVAAVVAAAAAVAAVAVVGIDDDS